MYSNFCHAVFHVLRGARTHAPRYGITFTFAMDGAHLHLFDKRTVLQDCGVKMTIRQARGKILLLTVQLYCCYMNIE
jgi:hypothetical protein